MIAGQSAITRWRGIDTGRIYSKIGGDLSDYDLRSKLADLANTLPAAHARIRKPFRKAPFSTKLSMLVACDAWLDGGLDGAVDPERLAVVVGGHNLNKHYEYDVAAQFHEEPDWMDSLAALLGLDTDHAGCVAQALNARGAIHTTGGACASANLALRHAVDELRMHDHDVAVVVGAALEFGPIDLHAMALMGAISFESFNDEPARASRPWDVQREGFVPSHGTAALVVERLDHALARGATIHAEVLGVEATSDANHLPNPSMDGQIRTMQRVLRRADVEPTEVDFVSAHATSTPLGDLTELRSIKHVFGTHAYDLKINAPKSMLGHTCWSAPAVETVAALLQMRHGRLHPSINADELEPEVDVDVCANEAVDHDIRTVLKNSFGFGGINCCALFRRYEG